MTQQPYPPQQQPAWRVTAQGYNGTISFDGRRVTIERSGFVARATQGSGIKVIPLDQIVAVQWKKAGLGTRGYMELSLASAHERGARPQTLMSQNMDNENAVVFSRKQQDDVRRVYDAIMGAI